MLPVFLLVVSLVVGAESTESHCLRSDVLCTTADYKLRRYKESVWVGTHVDASISPRVDDFMQHLIRYTRGGNSAGLWMKSKGPFLIAFTGDGKITMYLLVPEELWENPPKPTSSQTFITPIPTMDVFSKRILWNAMTQANGFNRTLTELNVKFNNSFFFVSFCKGKVRRRARSPGKRRRRCRTSPPPQRCKDSGGRIAASPQLYRWRRVGMYSPLGEMTSFQLEGHSKRSMHSFDGAFTIGGRFFWGAEVSVGGVSYDFSSMPAGNEVWFVATGEVDCPLT